MGPKFWVPILVSEGSYLFPISLTAGSILGPYFCLQVPNSFGHSASFVLSDILPHLYLHYIVLPSIIASHFSNSQSFKFQLVPLTLPVGTELNIYATLSVFAVFCCPILEHLTCPTHNHSRFSRFPSRSQWPTMALAPQPRRRPR